ncbi:hypothetical protein [Streptomyces sp. NPDC127190]|uniref:hypothetical protein n=1 Tax=unclassified Streptomyces TaxID=2593676 RepID=UPI003645901D
MSDVKKTTEAETSTTEVTTMNTHATSEPLKPAAANIAEEIGVVSPDNTHATDEKA